MRFFKLFSLLFFTFQISHVVGQSAQPYAVYMYSFTRYINWPAETQDDFLMGVLGESPVTPHLHKMAVQKQVNGRTIRLITFQTPEEVSADLDMLLINDQWSEREDLVRKMTNELPHCLVITQAGTGHINFIQEDGRLLFELNKAQLEDSGWRISSELLALARVVEENQSN